MIAEGVATAATLHRTLRVPVVAALHAGNLAPVARALSRRHRRSPLVLAADDDHEAPGGNTGWIKAQEAARQLGAVAVRPEFGEADRGLSDFNDLARTRGPGAVRAILLPALERAARATTREAGRDR